MKTLAKIINTSLKALGYACIPGVVILMGLYAYHEQSILALAHVIVAIIAGIYLVYEWSEKQLTK